MNNTQIYRNNNETNNSLSFQGFVYNNDYIVANGKCFNFNSVKISCLPFHKNIKVDVYYYPATKFGTTTSGNLADSQANYDRDPRQASYWDNRDKFRQDTYVSAVTYTPKFSFILAKKEYGFYQFPILGEIMEIKCTILNDNNTVHSFSGTPSTEKYYVYLNTLMVNTTSEMNQNIF